MSDVLKWHGHSFETGWVDVTETLRRKAAVEWYNDRPPAIRALMKRFPPTCMVSATVPLCVPAPGRQGEVVSYFDPDEDHPEGSLGVLGESLTLGWFKAQCTPEQLVVASVEGIDPMLLDLMGYERAG